MKHKKAHEHHDNLRSYVEIRGFLHFYKNVFNDKMGKNVETSPGFQGKWCLGFAKRNIRMATKLYRNQSLTVHKN